MVYRLDANDAVYQRFIRCGSAKPVANYYADDLDYSPTPRTQLYAYAGMQTEMQKQIGKILREQYQPPQELPHQLLVLLIKADQQGMRREKKW